MEALLAAIRAVKPWQIGLMIAVAVTTGAATYGAYLLATGSEGGGLGEDQQLIPVQRGDLVNAVSINGSLVYSQRETLRFTRQGTVEELAVDEGQRVEGDQVLARLDAETVANLEKVVAQGRINVRNAEEALATTKSPHTARDLAKAASDVANTRLSLDAAQEALGKLLNPTDLDVAQAQAAVANAEASLKNAEDALAGVMTPTDLEIAQAEVAAVNAKLSAENARDALDKVIGGPPDADLDDAQPAVDSAATALANSEGDLKLTRKDWDSNVAAAEEALTSAQDGYRGVFDRWLGIRDGVNLELSPDEMLDFWGADLNLLFNQQSYADQLLAFIRESASDDPDTPWDEVVLYTWLAFFPGTLAVTCEDGLPPSQGGACIRNEIDDAWQELQDKTDNLDTVQTQSAKAIANTAVAVTNAAASLTTRQEALEELSAGPDPLEIESARKTLALTEAAQEKAEEELATILAKQREGPDPLDLEVEERQVAVAKAKLDKAEEDLGSIINGIDPLQIDVKETQVELTRASLAESVQALAELKTIDQLEIALREADLISATAALDAALEALEGATLRAPWPGIVASIEVEAGQQVNPDTPVLEIIDPTAVEVDGIVDEIDVLFIGVDAPANVTLEALQDQVLPGVVSEIAQTARSQQGIVSYPIRIRVTTPAGTELPEGLSAVAQVVIREEKGALLIPLQALRGTFEEPTVHVMVNGHIEDRGIVLGISDDFWTVVTEGLAEGDQVLMEVRPIGTSQFNIGSLRRLQAQPTRGGDRGGGGGRR